MKISEMSLERQIQLWGLAGPAAVLSTVSILLFTAPFEWTILPIMAIAGFTFAWLRGINGAGICIAFFMAATAAQLVFAGSQHALWMIGGSCALALSWIATALCKEEIDALVQLHPVTVPVAVAPVPAPIPQIIEKVVVDETKLNVARAQIETLEKGQIQLKNELDNAHEEIQSLQKQGEQYPIALKKLQAEHNNAIAMVRKDLDDALKDNAALERKLKEEVQARQDASDDNYLRQQEIQRKETGLEALRIELDKARTEKEKAIFELEALKKENEQKARAEEAVVWGDTATREGRALSRVEGMYQQLRGQYEEKSKTLDETRFELFHTKEQLALLQREHEEEFIYDRPQAVERFERHIHKLEAELACLEKENEALEDIVSKLV